MADEKEKKAPLGSGSSAENSDSAENQTNKKPKRKLNKAYEDNIIKDTETAKKRGRNGGLKTAEVKRQKKNAMELCQYLLAQMTKSSNVRKNLVELGFEDNEMNNLAALYGRLFTMAMSGDLNAFNTLMKMAGYDPEENRKERESKAADARRERELDIKVNALVNNPQGLSASLNFSSEDDGNDVVIYMPKIMEEQECEVAGEEAPIDNEQPQGE